MKLKYYIDYEKYTDEQEWVKVNIPSSIKYSFRTEVVIGTYRSTTFCVIDTGDDDELAMIIKLKKVCEIIA